MLASTFLSLLFSHPLELRTLIQFKLFYERRRDISSQQEHPSSGWNRKSMRRCWEFLDLTSRSFSAVIKELDGDLARTICLFYLVLRGLDTIEDDMTIPDEVKQPLLRSFHESTVSPGWTFNGSGPDEKDRQLLIEYDVVVEEVNLLLPQYKRIIVDICYKMEQGMADYAHKAATTGSIYLDTVAEYDIYCHYVAGLVGEGLSRIWAASGKEAPYMAAQIDLSNSMGLLLQKTNIIRDYPEDVEQRRYFWPREIWSAPESAGFAEMSDMCKPGAEERAAVVQSGMIVDALRHATDSLDYLHMLTNQSVFNFCAIPAVMAMATLALCFRNPQMFQRIIKIRKAEAAGLIMRSTNTREVAYLFRDYARRIHAKAVPTDPNFLRVCVACGKIEQWCERHYPSFVQVMSSNGNLRAKLNPTDARSRVFLADQHVEEAPSEKDVYAHCSQNGPPSIGNGSARSATSGGGTETVTYIFIVLALVLGTSLVGVYLRW